MSGNIEDPGQCELVQDELAEFALGTLYGRSRSEVLHHVGSCARCAAKLERFSVVADTLLQLAPEIEPPLGFELRLAERIQTSASVHRPRRFRRASALSVAAMVMVVLGFGLGMLVTPRGANNQGRSATANLTSANLTSQGHVLGEVVISGGSPAWMFMTVNEGARSGRVICDVTLAGGKVESIGAFVLTGGYGSWGAPLTSPVSKVRSARLIAQNGTVLATAQLSV
jgi:anti-sigma factor RsiW